MASSTETIVAESLDRLQGETASACRCKAAILLTLLIAGATLWTAVASGSAPCAAGIVALTCLAVFAEVQSFCRRRTSERAGVQSRLAQKYLDIAGVMLLAVNDRGEVTLINQQGQRILGYREEELLGRDWFATCLPMECRAEARDIFARLLRGEVESTSAVENVVVTKWGRERLIAWRNTLLTDRSGRVVGVLSSGEDVTERRRAEEALRQSEQRYRLVAENAKDVIWTADLNMRWTYISPSVELLQGFTAEEAMQMPLEQMLAPESARLVRESLMARQAAERTDPNFQFGGSTKEVEALCKDGSRVWTEARVSFLRGEGGRPIGLLGVVRDISERKRAEEELKTAKLAAEAANRAKSEFLTNMSHEIRTPMTAILGFADVLAENLTAPEDLEMLRTIRRNGKHLLEIINDILDISKIEAGKMAYQHVPFSPVQVISEVVTMMRGRAEENGLDLAVTYAGPLPERITSDPTRLRQILINLVGNAIKFTEQGRVDLEVHVQRQEGGRGLLMVAVRDTGIGIEPEEIDRLFAPFSQGDPTNSRRYGGTGLGLAISRRLAQSLGGEIRCESTDGLGSTFYVAIDAGPLDGVEWLDGAEVEQGTRREERAPRRRRKLDCRILLAEDGPDNQRLLSLVLGKAGAAVTVVGDGRVALEKALEQRPSTGSHAEGGEPPYDVILMDMEMPVLNGYEATRRLRAAGYAGPILALTAHAMAQDVARTLEAGCDACLSKPIDSDALLAAIADHVGPRDATGRDGTSSNGRPTATSQAETGSGLEDGEWK